MKWLLVPAALSLIGFEALLRHALVRGELGIALLHGLGGDATAAPWILAGLAWLLVRPLALLAGAALTGWLLGTLTLHALEARTPGRGPS